MKFDPSDKIEETENEVIHESAGGFLFYRPPGKELLVALLKKSEGYYLPKGHLKIGEQPQEAASREIMEELCLEEEPNLVTKLGIDSFDFTLHGDKRIHHKKVHLYIFQTEMRIAIRPRKKENFERADWLTLDEAEKKLAFDKDHLKQAAKIFERVSFEERYYEKIKRLNIRHYAGEVAYYSQANLRLVEEKLLVQLKKGLTLLDLGCGSGRFSIGAAQKGFKVLGIDITPPAVEAAREKSKKLNLENVKFEVGDMTKLNLNSDRFDYVICLRYSINAVATFSERSQAVREMIRVVKPGGRVYLESFNRFWLKRGLLMPLKNMIIDLIRIFRIKACILFEKEYRGLLPGDMVYPSNKVKGAPEGYAHIPTVFELRKLIPKGIKYKINSSPEIAGLLKFDPLRFFRYALWITLEK